MFYLTLIKKLICLQRLIYRNTRGADIIPGDQVPLIHVSISLIWIILFGVVLCLQQWM